MGSLVEYEFYGCFNVELVEFGTAGLEILVLLMRVGEDDWLPFYTRNGFSIEVRNVP